MTEITLITTIYSVEPVMAAATKFSPEKIILLREDDAPPEKLRAERMIRETIGKVVEVDTKLTSIYDVVGIARDTVDVVEEEKARGRDIIVNITGARKTQSLGALYGAYARRELVEKVIYITEEDNEVIELPLLSFDLSKTKKRMLEEIKAGEGSVRKIARRVGISRAMAYHHIRELKEGGFIEDRDGLRITTAGRLAIL